jgi:hypothetical protein
MEPSRIRWTPSSEEDCQAVCGELKKVLESPQFCNSKRYPGFLRYVVDQTLAGKTDIKERTIGIEVFGRPADYDSNNDSVVRYTAGEVRKRLALYHSKNPDAPIEIVLSSRSYNPEFYRLDPEGVSHEASGAASGPVAGGRRRMYFSRRRLQQIAFAVLFVLLGAAACWVTQWLLVERANRPINRFWLPVMQAKGQVLISPGQVTFSAASRIGTVVADSNPGDAYFSFGNSLALARIASLMSMRKRDYEPEPAAALTLDLIRQNPVVLIGAYNNIWTRRLLAPLRFRFSEQPTEAIVDAWHPEIRWTRDASRPFDNATDYGIVARFRNPSTDSMVVVVAGLQRYGTDAASQFVVSPRFLELVDRQIGSDWTNKNIEAVIRVDVVNGSAGAPTIERVHVW